MKAAQLRDMTMAELREQLAKDRQEVFNLRFRAATQQVENPRRTREVRKNVARILTILQEREAQSQQAGSRQGEQ
jgi:large subunit ribosomal protein L29